MTIWWENLISFQQVMFVIAAISTVIMTIFLVLMLIGIDGTDSFDGGGLDSFDGGDIDAFDGGHIEHADMFNHEPLSGFSGLKVLTLRGVLAFFSIGGWVAFLLAGSSSVLVSILFGILSGAIASYLLALAFRAAMKLESSGNLDYKNAIGKTGTVYIKIPGSSKGKGKGKVTLTFQEKFSEVDAITDELEDLVTGTRVVIVGVDSESTLIEKRKIIKEKKDE